MSEETLRRVRLTRLGLGRYEATNDGGTTLRFGSGGGADFTPVELLLTAIGGCSAADVDHITAKRSEPVRFEVSVTGDKVRDGSGNHLKNLSVTFDIGFPDDEGGDAARSVLPRAVDQSHDRLCTVTRTVELGTAVRMRALGAPPAEDDFATLTGETERMTLRGYRPEDFEAFADLHARDDVTRYLPWETRDEAASRAALERHLDMRLRREGDGITLAGFDKDTGRLVGEFVLIRRSLAQGGGEVGYVLHPDFQGRGLATEGARAILDLAFGTVGLRRVVARVDARNTASAAVLRRLGMRHEAHLVQNDFFKGEWTDEDDFALLVSEWREGPGAAVVWRREARPER